jgi:hypothetical protein
MDRFEILDDDGPAQVEQLTVHPEVGSAKSLAGSDVSESMFDSATSAPQCEPGQQGLARRQRSARCSPHAPFGGYRGAAAARAARLPTKPASRTS